MFEEKTVLNSVTVDELNSGFVSALFNHQVLKDGVVISSENHRVTLAPDADINAVFDVVAMDLANRGKPPIQAGDIATVKSYCELARAGA